MAETIHIFLKKKSQPSKYSKTFFIVSVTNFHQNSDPTTYILIIFNIFIYNHQNCPKMGFKIKGQPSNII